MEIFKQFDGAKYKSSADYSSTHSCHNKYYKYGIYTFWHCIQKYIRISLEFLCYKHQNIKIS